MNDTSTTLPVRYQVTAKVCSCFILSAAIKYRLELGHAEGIAWASMSLCSKSVSLFYLKYCREPPQTFLLLHFEGRAYIIFSEQLQDL